MKNRIDMKLDDRKITPPSRRAFVKKAAAVTVAAGLGGAALSKRAIPESSAESYCTYCVVTDTQNYHGNLAVWTCIPPCCCPPTCLQAVTDSVCPTVPAHFSGWINTTCCPCCPICLGAALIVENTACLGISCPVGLAGQTEGTSEFCWPPRATGVLGTANTGVGVSGSSKSGIGVLGYALGPCSTPIAAFGAEGQKGNIQQWTSPCHPESVVASNGYFGIGTTSPKALLHVNGTFSGTRLGVGTTTPEATLSVSGSVSTKLVTKSAAYPMTASDFGVLANAASAPFDVTLPPASTAVGMIVFIKKTDSSGNAVTVKGNGSGATQDKIEGVTSKALSSQYHSLTLVSNGAKAPGNWFVLASGS